MLIAMLLMIALNFLFPVTVIIPSPWNLLGLIPIGLGIYTAVVAENAFRHAKTTITPVQESSVLVTNGMYRISRNPMYLGFVFTLIGIALLLRSLTPFGVIPAFIVIIKTTFIRVEEQMLTEKFGLQYTAYAHKTRRWL